MDFSTIILAAFVIGLAYYFYYKKNNIFIKLGIPHEPPKFLVGSMGPCLFQKENIYQLMKKLYDRYSDVKYFGMYEFQTPVIVIRDPEIIKKIAIKNFEMFPDHRGFTDEKIDPLFGKGLFSLKGDEWKDMRNILSPSFTSSKMKLMFHLMMECVVNFTNVLVERSKDENYFVNLKDAFTRLSADIISSCAFGININSMKDPQNDIYVIGRNATDFEGVLSLKFLLIRNFKFIAKLLGIKIISNSVTRFFTNIVNSNIAMRRDKGIRRMDFLQLMMEAKDKDHKNQNLSVEEIAANTFLFFFGGLDTVSTAICYAAHEIAVNPEIQKRLQADIDAVLENCKGEVTYQEINDIPYLEAVIYESMRFYPPTPFLDRVCKKKFELPATQSGKNSVIIEPGMSVYFPVFALHHDPKYFENPNEFNPERFLGDEKINVHSLETYLPFGIGPRMCIGNRFALLEMKITLFHLLAKCNLRICSKTSIPLTIKKNSFALLPQGGFWLRIKNRDLKNL